MSKKGAVKTGSGDPGGKNKNSAMAAYMAKHGITRTTFRDPTDHRRTLRIGQYPGVKG